MKFAFVVHNSLYGPRMLELLKDAGIDYYTRWDEVKGKGHGTEPHLGAGGFQSTNSVLMIAFEEEAPLAALIKNITAANTQIKRADDKIRLFQLPLERIV
jgi:hypothetical protein